MNCEFDEIIDRNGTNAFNAEGFVRLNLALPRSLLEEGLRRMRDAIKACNTRTIERRSKDRGIPRA